METSARERILAAVKKGKPAEEPLPGIVGFPSAYSDLAAQFGTVLQGIGGSLVLVKSYEEVQQHLQQFYDLTKPVISFIPELPLTNITTDFSLSGHEFETLELLLLRGKTAVAENGSIWVDEESCGLRALPFISQQVSIVISEADLVGNMHEAYKQINFRTGYGAFIAGPSKTADIEQSLVIGAHGPKSLTVFLFRE